MCRRHEHVDEKWLLLLREAADQCAGVASDKTRKGNTRQVIELWQEALAKLVMGEQRQEQAHILGSLPHEILDVPLVLWQVHDVEAKRKLAEIASRPIAHRCSAIAVPRQNFGKSRNRKLGIFISDEVVPDAMPARPGSCQHRDQTRRGTRAWHVACREQGTVRCQ